MNRINYTYNVLPNFDYCRSKYWNRLHHEVLILGDS